MKLTEQERDVLIRVYCSWRASRKENWSPADKLLLEKLIKKELIKVTSFVTVPHEPTFQGLRLALESWAPIIDNLARRYSGQKVGEYKSAYIREAITSVIKTLAVSELPELLSHSCAYIRQKARARLVNEQLKATSDEVDRELARKLLGLGNSTIEAALRGGWLPTVPDAIGQWEEDLLLLDPTELARRYVEARLQLYNKSFTKRVAALAKPFEHLAEKFLGKESKR